MLRYFFLLVLVLFFAGCAEELVEEERIVVDDGLSFSELLAKGDYYYNNNPRLRLEVLASIDFYKAALLKGGKEARSDLYWKISRSYAYLSKYSSSSGDHSSYAEFGMVFAKKALEFKSSMEARYYYLLNMGLYAEVNTLSAMSFIAKMENEARNLANEGSEIDYAGVYRFLAILYHKVPGFLLKEDKSRSLYFFERASSISPLYPPNLFYYASFLLGKGMEEEARKYISSLLKIEKMHEDFAGELKYWKDKARKLLGL